MKFRYNNIIAGIAIVLCLSSLHGNLPENTFTFSELSSNRHAPQYLWTPLTQNVSIHASNDDRDTSIIRLGGESPPLDSSVCLDVRLFDDLYDFIISHKNQETQNYTDYNCSVVKDDSDISLYVDDRLVSIIKTKDAVNKYLIINLQEGETLQILHGDSFFTKVMCNEKARLAKVKNILKFGTPINISRMIPQFKHHTASNIRHKKTLKVKISNINNPTLNKL